MIPLRSFPGGPKILGANLAKWFVTAALIGVATGVAVAGLDFAVARPWEALQELMVRYPLLALMAPVAGLTLTGVIRDRLTIDPNMHGTEEVLEAYHERNGRLEIRDLMPKAVASATTIGLGGSAGLEGPSIHIGGGVGVALERLIRRLGVRTDRRILLMTGAAAGIGAVFKAPLTGLIFALEVPYKEGLEHKAVVPALIASVASYLTLCSILGTKPIFRYPSVYASVDLFIVLFAVAEGLVAGAASVGFVKLINAVESVWGEDTPYTLRGFLSGLGVGLIGLTSVTFFGGPHPLGTSYDLVRGALASRWGAEFFATMLLLKALTTALTLGGAGVGGVFIPTIVMGSALGAVWGQTLGRNEDLFVALGMSAMLSAGFKTPLTSVAFVAETTGSEFYLIPSIVASAAAYLISGPTSLPKNQRLMERIGLQDIGDIPVREGMGPAPPTVDARATLKEFVDEVLIKHPEFLTYPVVENGRVIGVIEVEDVERLAPELWEKTMVGDVARLGYPFVEPEEPVEAAVHKMYEYGVACLPVVEEGTRVVGSISAINVIALMELRARLRKFSIFAPLS
ncbi:MAG: chloride channel protein [Candidatus Korarchaeota archaeon]|nr:chloride channel protein [Candidatus Korarchaeota archaeon]